MTCSWLDGVHFVWFGFGFLVASFVWGLYYIWVREHV